MFKKSIAIAAIAAVLSACGGGNVQAQTIDSSFKTSSNDYVNIQEAVYVAKIGNNVSIVMDGTQMLIPDGTNELYNKLLTDAWFNQNFVRGAGAAANYWYRIDEVTLARCSAGVTTLYHTKNVAPAMFNDNCAAYDTIKARSK